MSSSKNIKVVLRVRYDNGFIEKMEVKDKNHINDVYHAVKHGGYKPDRAELVVETPKTRIVENLDVEGVIQSILVSRKINMNNFVETLDDFIDKRDIIKTWVEQGDKPMHIRIDMKDMQEEEREQFSVSMIRELSEKSGIDVILLDEFNEEAELPNQEELSFITEKTLFPKILVDMAKNIMNEMNIKRDLSISLYQIDAWITGDSDVAKFKVPAQTRTQEMNIMSM